MYNEDISNVNNDLGSYKERITNFSNEFEPGLFLHILRKNIILLISIVAIALTGSYIYLRYTSPTYEAKTIIQLGSSDQAKRILNVNQFSEDNSLLKEIELMKSKLLVTRVIKRLPLEITYFERGEFLTDQKYPRSSFDIELISIQDSSVRDVPVDVKFNADQTYHLELSGQKIGNTEAIGDIAVNPYFTYRLSITDAHHYRRVQESEVSFYFIINKASTLANKYGRQLSIKILNNTAKTIEISMRDNNSGIARDFVTAHAEEYIKYDLENREQSGINILRFIDNQLDTVYRNLRDSELQLNLYKQENKISNLDNLSGSYFQVFREFEEELLRLDLQESTLSQVIETISNEGDEMDVYQLIPLLSGSQYESTVSEMLQKLRQLLTYREELEFDTKEGATRRKKIENGIAIQKRLLIESVESLRATIRSRKGDIRQKMMEFESGFSELPDKELEFARLRRIFEINEKYYTMLLEKKTQYRISQAGFVTENRILERLISSSSPIAPQKGLITGGALAVSLLLGLGIVVLKYLLHNKITSINEIVKLSNASITVLGMIPKYKQDIPNSQLLVDKNPKSMIAEAFRSLRTNLQFLTDGTKRGDAKVIAITSTSSGEGKTFVAINLAGIIAYSDKKVIVLDLDMRKPKIHLGFDVENKKGMSTVLIGKSDLDETIVHSKVANLDFITAGPKPPNPAELVMGQRMQEVLSELKSRYDVIIIDNPPVGMVTDGIPMIRQADNPIYIFRADMSTKQSVQLVDRLINENNLDRLSVVLNCVDVERSKYGGSYGYGYGNGYGYGSNYGYGYYDEDRPQKTQNFFARMFGS